MKVNNLTGQITQNLVEQSRMVVYLLLYKEDSSRGMRLRRHFNG